MKTIFVRNFFEILKKQRSKFDSRSNPELFCGKGLCGYVLFPRINFWFPGNFSDSRILQELSGYVPFQKLIFWSPGTFLKTLLPRKILFQSGSIVLHFLEIDFLILRNFLIPNFRKIFLFLFPGDFWLIKKLIFETILNIAP